MSDGYRYEAYNDCPVCGREFIVTHSAEEVSRSTDGYIINADVHCPTCNAEIHESTYVKRRRV